MMLNLFFVPTWLERALKAYNEPLHAALDLDKLSRIISRRDLDLYKTVQGELHRFIPVPIVNSFNTLAVAGLPPLVAESPLVEDELVRQYLYGILPVTEDLPTTPGFKVTLEGYSQVILTVDPNPESSGDAVFNLMNVLLKTLNGALALEELAALPIFEYWLSSKPQ